MISFIISYCITVTCNEKKHREPHSTVEKWNKWQSLSGKQGVQNAADHHSVNANCISYLWSQQMAYCLLWKGLWILRRGLLTGLNEDVRTGMGCDIGVIGESVQ